MEKIGSGFRAGKNSDPGKNPGSATLVVLYKHEVTSPHIQKRKLSQVHGVSVSFATHKGITKARNHNSRRTSSLNGKRLLKMFMEMPGIEPGAFHMQSERSTTELHPPTITYTGSVLK
jgi:hypothetical protein